MKNSFEFDDGGSAGRRGRAGRQQQRKANGAINLEMTNHTSKREESPREQAPDEIDQSMDLQLHPLRDSTWAEIFPILSIFEQPYQNEDLERDAMTGNRRKKTKAYEFMKNEAIFAESHRGSGLDD